MEHQQIVTNGIYLHVVQEGPKSGPLVILLHGFPDFWYGWRRQIAFLGGEGFRVWAPDQRGYHLSEKPEGVASYRIEELGADVLGLIDAGGEGSAFIVGHDWGAAVGWWLAEQYPERIKGLIAMNVPHRSVMHQHLRHSVRQFLKSWYIFFFQLPWLPEALAPLGRWWGPSRALQASSRPGAFSKDDLERYRRAWSQPRAFRCMLHWYRAAVRMRPTPPTRPRISAPTLLIWGARDRFLDPAMAQPSIDLCEDGTLEMIEEARHWVHLEEYAQVNALMLNYLQDKS